MTEVTVSAGDRFTVTFGSKRVDVNSAGQMYVLLKPATSIDRTVEVAPGVSVDYSPSGQVVGVEVL